MSATSLDPLLSRVGSEGLGVLDAAGRLRPVNVALRDLLGAEECSVDALPIDAGARRWLRRFLAGASPQGETVARWRSAAGTRVVRLSVLRGTEVCAVAVRDETELQRARRELERCARLRAVGRIARHLVHDMNNHMGAVLGLGDALAPAEDDDRGLVDALRSSAQRAGRTLEAVTMLLRRAGTRTPRTDLVHVVEDAVRLVHKPMLAARRSLELTIAPDLPPVRCVPQETTHALVTLLLFANETSSTSAIRMEVAAERRRRRGDLPARRCGVVRIEDGGDPERSPLQSPDVRLAVGVVQARGALLECRRDAGGRRRLELTVPAAGRRPS